MFASWETSTPVMPSSEDGVVDIRDMLGKCGRSTELDNPVVVITEKSSEIKTSANEPSVMEEIKEIPEEKEIKLKKALVLDSRAFFLRKISVEALSQDRRNPSENESVEFTTCNDVLKEIKDEQTRLYVDNLPFKLNCEDPSDSALKFVSTFAKETGDYKSLSGTDIRVIALAYSIIQKRNETQYWRKSPPELIEFKPTWAKPTNKKEEKTKPKVEEDDEEGWEVVEKKSKPKKKKFRRNIKKDFYPEAFLNDLASNKKNNHNDPENKDTKETEPGKEVKEDEILEEIIPQNTEKKEILPESALEETHEESIEKPSEENNVNEDDILVQKDTAETVESDENSEEDDCDDEWITPDNLNTYLLAQDDQGHDNEKVEDNSSKISVEVVTSDFAMQNVLMQIGIPWVSLEGVEIRQIKRFKLRCDGCKEINQRVDIEFCQKWGGHTLRKVSVFASSNGKITFFKGKRLKKNNRGVQYSIPVPKSGRDSHAMILREDQLWIGQNKLKMKEKLREEDRVKNKIGDHFNDYVSFEHAKKNEKTTGGETTFGYGRKNPNIPNKKYSKKKKR